jgi:hypothetical protein
VTATFRFSSVNEDCKDVVRESRKAILAEKQPSSRRPPVNRVQGSIDASPVAISVLAAGQPVAATSGTRGLRVSLSTNAFGERKTANMIPESTRQAQIETNDSANIIAGKIVAKE